MSQNKKDKNESKQDNKLIMLIIGLAILIIALAGVAIFYVKNQDKKDEKTLAYTNLIKETEKILKSEHISMVIFDEFNSANELNLLDKDYAYKLICEYKDKTEIILTGRNPEEKYVEISDYISEINCIKHPFESGVNARKGIEY